MTSALGFLSIYVTALSWFASAGAIYYEEISESGGNKIHEGSMQHKPVINKSYHQCSMKETCNYVTEDISNSSTSIYDSADELPLGKTGLRVWKKIHHGPLKDCRDVYNRGNRQDGVFTIDIPIIGLSQVPCDLTTQPAGWIIFQRRVDASVSFNRNWADYKEGFGDINGNFWLGLEKLHRLAAPGKGATLRVDLKHMDFPGKVLYAEYKLFEISDESKGYRLNVGSYSGNTGDSLSFQNSAMFSTSDRDQDTSPDNCAIEFYSAWWFMNCFSCNLNGIFPPNSDTNIKYISWYHLQDSYGKISFSEMKIR